MSSTTHRISPPRLRLALAAVSCALAVAACGGSGGGARALVRETFTGHHPIDSGRLAFAITVYPSGSSTLTSPVSLSFGGPFESRGRGALPASDFQASLTLQGHTASLGLISTGTAGYVSLAGTAYRLPAADFQRLQAGFAQVTPSSGRAGGLGLDPQSWLTAPRIVGSATVAGARTTHIRAGIDVQKLLYRLSALAQRASAAGVSGATGLAGGIPQSTRQQIAAEVRQASFDLWTGSSDHTLRRLQVGLTLPVTGQISALLGGLRSARVVLVLQYSELNRPQVIAAPTRLAPYSQFSVRLRSLLRSLEGSLIPGAG
jgi:hypothetical protein